MGNGPSRDEYDALQKELENVKSLKKQSKTFNKRLQTKIDAFTEKVRKLEIQRDFAKALHQKEIENLNRNYKERINQLEVSHKIVKGSHYIILFKYILSASFCSV